jgi:hypothetical protein
MMAGLGLLIVAIYTGYAIPRPSMKVWFRWLSYAQPIPFGFEAILTNECEFPPQTISEQEESRADVICFRQSALLTFLVPNSFLPDRDTPESQQPTKLVLPLEVFKVPTSSQDRLTSSLNTVTSGLTPGATSDSSGPTTSSSSRSLSSLPNSKRTKPLPEES